MKTIQINESIQLTEVIESMRAEMIALQQIVNHDRNVEFEQKNREYERSKREQEWKQAEARIESDLKKSWIDPNGSFFEGIRDYMIEEYEDIEKTPEELAEEEKKRKNAERARKSRARKEIAQIEKYLTWEREKNKLKKSLISQGWIEEYANDSAWDKTKDLRKGIPSKLYGTSDEKIEARLKKLRKIVEPRT